MHFRSLEEGFLFELSIPQPWVCHIRLTFYALPLLLCLWSLASSLLCFFRPACLNPSSSPPSSSQKGNKAVDLDSGRRGKLVKELFHPELICSRLQLWWVDEQWCFEESELCWVDELLVEVSKDLDLEKKTGYPWDSSWTVVWVFVVGSLTFLKLLLEDEMLVVDLSGGVIVPISSQHIVLRLLQLVLPATGISSDTVNWVKWLSPAVFWVLCIIE